MTLDELPRGHRAVVTALDVRGGERRRLMDLGLLPGAAIRADMTSPLGDPTAYEVRGALVVLRRGQARAVRITDTETVETAAGHAGVGER